ncbi:polysaccharide pyruvyl transferase family protein [Intestinibacter bartlettii]|uniref:Polysaccharide pyruvyl transferase family protein n=1 Tax=Intestinibacter bartlettii TaxID=261299 RepID=A0ABS6E006_9FIRM|nr:polysaccharide pyruvyl transferase family protein [Intestinibacter bartlettii]MBU5337317.1 polysaccharide pyruvyl transferase family protein [Intestinibacter bartlettii]
MSNIKLYSHGGSKNHGCEAIVRGTYKVINKPMVLYSMNPDEDIKYGIDKIMTIKKDTDYEIKNKSIEYYLSAANIKLFKSTELNTKYRKKKFLSDINNEDIYISIGGDNYCYSGVNVLGDINSLIHKRGAKTVLWGCSINEDILNDINVIKDLKLYNLIVARESLTYNALRKAGITENVVLYPDPAFQLDKEELQLPEGFIDGNTIGINISPLIISSGKENGMVKKNYEKLIEHIIHATDMQIILIPHVTWEHNNDREPIVYLYNKYKDTGRVIMLEKEYNCMQLKGFIARCRMFIGARTHATIAAYSTCVPTLVVGYSIKAKGIAKDLFGDYKNYVVSAQNMNKSDELITAFEWMKKNEESIRKHLNSFIPSYKEKALLAGEKIREMAK